MPARRRFDSRAGPITNAAANADNENVRSRYQRPGATDDEGGQHPIGDRSVLRVRNFTTKDGNIINRGDSIKIRRGTKTAGLSSPLGKDNLRSFGNSISVPQNRDVRLSPRSGSLKSTANAAGFGARKSIAVSMVSCEGSRLFSSSATHLAVGRNEGSPDIEGPQTPRRDSQLRCHRLSRQFQSQDEERLIAGSNSAVQSPGRLVESELSASTSSNLGSRGFRPPSHSSTQHTQIGEEAIELDYLGEAGLTHEEPYVQSPRRIPQQQCQGSQMSISANVVVEEQNENETEEGEVQEETQDGRPADYEEEQVVYKVVVMGSIGVGKTTLTHQMLTSEYLANNENELGKPQYCCCCHRSSSLSSSSRHHHHHRHRRRHHHLHHHHHHLCLRHLRRHHRHKVGYLCTPRDTFPSFCPSLTLSSCSSSLFQSFLCSFHCRPLIN